VRMIMSDESKKAAEIRLYRGVRKLYKAGAVLDDAGALLSALTGLGNQCEQIRELRRKIQPIIYSMQKLEGRGVCDLDETMQSILRQKAAGKTRAAKKGGR